MKVSRQHMEEAVPHIAARAILAGITEDRMLRTFALDCAVELGINRNTKQANTFMNMVLACVQEYQTGNPTPA